MGLVATVLLTAVVAAVCWRRPGFFAIQVTGIDSHKSTVVVIGSCTT
jgi:hypothetical protein